MKLEELRATSGINTLRLAETNTGAPNEAYAVLDQNSRAVASILDTYDEAEGESRITEENVMFAHDLVRCYNQFPELVKTLARLELAAFNREISMGDPCSYLEHKAELAAAAKKARDVLEIVRNPQILPKVRENISNRCPHCLHVMTPDEGASEMFADGKCTIWCGMCGGEYYYITEVSV